MRFLADMGVAASTVRELAGAGHDAVHLRGLDLQRLPDEEILAKARDERRIVLTFDLDFGDLLALGMHESPSVIIFRLRDETPRSVTPKLFEVIRQRASELEAGAVVVVEDSRYRLRRLPLRTTENPK